MVDWQLRNDVDETLDDARWITGRVFFTYILPFMILVCIIVGICWVFGIFGQGAKIIEKTMDADNVLNNYEWFKQCYEDIKATDIKIKNAEQQIMSFEESAGPRKDWSFEDKNEHARLNSVLLGLQNYREEQVAKYNARSKMVNRKIFKSGELPESVQ